MSVHESREIFLIWYDSITSYWNPVRWIARTPWLESTTTIKSWQPQRLFRRDQCFNFVLFQHEINWKHWLVPTYCLCLRIFTVNLFVKHTIQSVLPVRISLQTLRAHQPRNRLTHHTTTQPTRVCRSPSIRLALPLHLPRLSAYPRWIRVVLPQTNWWRGQCTRVLVTLISSLLRGPVVRWAPQLQHSDPNLISTIHITHLQALVDQIDTHSWSRRICLKRILAHCPVRLPFDRYLNRAQTRLIRIQTPVPQADQYRADWNLFRAVAWCYALRNHASTHMAHGSVGIIQFSPRVSGLRPNIPATVWISHAWRHICAHIPVDPSFPPESRPSQVQLGL